MNMNIRYAFVLCTLSACGSGEGEVRVTAYGESYIEAGIPVDVMTDGWSVTFDHFTVSLDDIMVGGLSVPAKTVDLTEPSNGQGQELGRIQLPEDIYTDSRYSIVRIEVAGSASKEGVTKQFEWTFDEGTAYTDCEANTMVTDGGTSEFQITVHADHLFFDSIVSNEPQILFQPLADTDTNQDDIVSSEELGATDIGAYDPGNESIDDLWSWLMALHRTVGHVDGEGHCDAKTIP